MARTWLPPRAEARKSGQALTSAATALERAPGGPWPRATATRTWRPWSRLRARIDRPFHRRRAPAETRRRREECRVDSAAESRYLTRRAAPSAPSGAPPSRARHTMFVFVVALAIITYIDRVCISQTAGTIRGELGLSESQMGVLGLHDHLRAVRRSRPAGWAIVGRRSC